MNSQLALVLTNGSLDDWKRSPCSEGSASGTGEETVSPMDGASSCPSPGNLQPPPCQTVARDARSIYGKEAKVDGTTAPAPQEIGGPAVVQQLITVKTGVPALCKQPIKIKIVVPSLGQKSITNSSVSSTTKEPSNCTSSPTSGTDSMALTADMNTDRTPIGHSESAITACAVGKTSLESALQCLKKDREERGERDSDVMKDKIGDYTRVTVSDRPFPSHLDTAKEHGESGAMQEKRKKEITGPLSWQGIEWKAVRRKEQEVGEAEDGQGGREEQTEAMDLSLPKKRERKEKKCVRVVADSVWESPLIMEVDEVEGEIERDIVEEDDPEETIFYAANTSDSCFGESPLLSPSFFSTSIFTSLSSIETDTEDILLIDDQGIPYMLTPDGHKLPQIDCSKMSDPRLGHQVVQPDSVKYFGKELSHSNASGAVGLSTRSDTTPLTEIAPRESIGERPPASTVEPAQEAAHSQTTELLLNSESTLGPCEDTKPGSAGSAQHIQIVTNPASNTPIFLLSPCSSSPSSQFSSAPLSLSLPLSLTQNASSSSTQMFLLLSSPASSAGHSFSTSRAIAVLDPSTGQLSQITTASSAVSPGAPLPSAASHPIIRLTPNNPPVVLSAVSNALVTPGPSLTPLSIPSSTPAQQSTSLLSSAALLTPRPDPLDPQSEARCTSGKVQSEPDQELSAQTESPPHPESLGVTSDSKEAEAKGLPAPDARVKSSDTAPESLLLEDHLYFSSTTPPLSPPLGPGNLDPLDPLDPTDPLDPLDPLDPGSPSSLGPRRVLYCQLCPRVFFYLSDLERHAITHSQNKPHVCQQCGKAFKRASHLQRHRHIHTGQRNYVCPICAKRFREAGELQRHQRVHTGEKPYQCQLCHIRFAERNTLRRHTKRKHPYHQVAMEMLSERRGGGSGGGMGGGGGGLEEEESAEWYSSTVSNMDNSDSES